VSIKGKLDNIAGGVACHTDPVARVGRVGNRPGADEVGMCQSFHFNSARASVSAVAGTKTR
jgi:hypothetical protein